MSIKFTKWGCVRIVDMTFDSLSQAIRARDEINVSSATLHADECRVTATVNKIEGARAERVYNEIIRQAEAAAAASRRGPRAKPDARKYRELIGANGSAAPTITTADGRTLRLDGYGRPFVGGEFQGPYWGDLCRYAYYV